MWVYDNKLYNILECHGFFFFLNPALDTGRVSANKTHQRMTAYFSAGVFQHREPDVSREGGGLLWLRQGPYGKVWGWGWIGWSWSTKEARGDPNAPLTFLSWWRGDGSIATCHIIIDTGERTRHSDSASMADRKLPICKQGGCST